MFTQSQIQHLLDIIDFQSSLFIVGNLSTDVLSEEDKQILSKFGIDWESFKSTYTPAQQLFYFGRLAGVLGPLNAQKVTYKDLEKYLQRGQFVPLNPTEKKVLSYLEKKTYNYIKGLGETIKSSLTGKIADEDLARRSYYEHVLNEAFKEKVINNASIKDVVDYIGKNTGDWERDLGRIAETELQNFYEYGKGEVLAEKYGGDKKIFYKQVYPGACQHCIRLYLTNGIGSEPKLFTYQQLLDNGSNVGRKSSEWKAVVGTVHPFCYDDKTEVLTDKGFKLFKDLDKTESFFSYNIEENVSEWVKAQDWIDTFYEGDMICRKNKNFDLITTPNHTHVVSTYRTKKIKLVDEKNLVKSSKFLCHIPNWEGVSYEYIEIDDIKYDAKTFFEFVGYYISEGSRVEYKYKDKNCIERRLHISQSSKKHLDKMFNCCSKLFKSCSKQKDYIHIIGLSKLDELWEFLNLGKSGRKFVPELIKGASKDLLSTFLTAFRNGDGSLTKGRVWDGYTCKDSELYYTSSERLRDDLSEIILKLGDRPSYKQKQIISVYDKKRKKFYTQNKPIFVINRCISNYVYRASLEESVVPYRGRVYDVTLVKNNTLVVRRNGKICVSGNCRCDLRTKHSKDDIWDDELQMFVPKRDEEQIPGKIKISVGDKTFEV